MIGLQRIELAGKRFVVRDETEGDKTAALMLFGRRLNQVTPGRRNLHRQSVPAG